MKKALVMKPDDSVAVCIDSVKADEVVTTDFGDITALQDIPMPHKIARRDIAAGEPVIKYSYVIGYALTDIKKGEWVHVHNMGPEKPTN